MLTKIFRLQYHNIVTPCEIMYKQSKKCFFSVSRLNLLKWHSQLRVIFLLMETSTSKIPKQWARTCSTKGSGLNASVISICILSVSLRFFKRKLPESLVSAYLLTTLSRSLWEGQCTMSDQPSTTSGVNNLTSPLRRANSVLYMAWTRSQRGLPVALLHIFWSISASSALEPRRLRTTLRVPSLGSPYCAK